MPGKPQVLIAAPVHAVLTDWLGNNGYECKIYEQIRQEEALGLVADCAGIITSTRLQVNRQLIDAAPGLKWIGRLGSGMEVIDVAYAESKGINCYSSPEGNSNAVAEHALGMLLSLNKKIIHSNSQVKQGVWIRDANRGTELEGKTIAIIGFGNTGRAFAKKLSVFDMRILIYDKYNCKDVPEYVESCNNLERIYEESDIISFHVPLQADTLHYFDNSFLANMKKRFVLMNTSRGQIIDNNILEKGLVEGKISGACIDVWEQEPISEMNDETKQQMLRIANMQNVAITPHIAGYSYEAIYKMSKVLTEKLSCSSKMYGGLR